MAIMTSLPLALPIKASFGLRMKMDGVNIAIENYSQLVSRGFTT